MLVKNAQNLMNAVIQTIEAAEAAYIKVIKNSFLLSYSDPICVFYAGSETS